MDKPLKDSDKIESQAAPGQAGSALPEAPVGAYSPELTAQAWVQSGKPWNASPQGRLAIRLVSRGVLGAAFFTVGGALTTKWLRNYDSEAKLLEQTNPLGVISKLIDMVVGKPVELVVKTITGSEALGKQAVTFRPSGLGHTSKRLAGRSLGHEVSAVSFDFFCASIGDALGRDIAGVIDPNVKKSWMKDGHIVWPKAIKQMMKNTWRYVSYNGGEDWAVAIPYCYFMKGHRSLVNHFSPGFAYDFDRNLNGGSSRFSGGEHVGNYNRGGILDLQHRFVVYNMGTVAYREAYNFIGDKLKGKKSVLYGAPDKPEPQSVGEKVGNGLKWMARSVIKGAIYMTPAVPFFWITRTPQTKFRGLVIDPEQGQLVHLKNGKYEPALVSHADMGSDFHWAKLDPKTQQLTFTRTTDHPLRHGPINPNAKSFGTLDAGLNAIAKASDGVRKPLFNAGKSLDEKLGGQIGQRTDKHLGNNWRGMANTYVNAAMSYTPYMYAKAEFANLWDDGKMDMSIERAIDGATQLNFGEFKAGLREIGYSILHKPLPEAAREIEAQRRKKLDTSAADVFNEPKNEMGRIDELRAVLEDAPKQSSWEQRMITGKKDPLAVSPNRPTSFAEQEKMRKALEEAHPPTNSIN